VETARRFIREARYILAALLLALLFIYPSVRWRSTLPEGEKQSETPEVNSRQSLRSPPPRLHHAFRQAPPLPRTPEPALSSEENSRTIPTMVRYVGLTPERARLLYELADVYIIPSLNIQTGRGPVTLEEVLNMFPYMREPDGSVFEQATAVQALLQTVLELQLRREELAQAGGDVQAEMQALRQESNEATRRLMDLIHPKNYTEPRAPFQIVPTRSLIEIDPGFERLSRASMQIFLMRLAYAQTSAERLPVEKVRSSFNDFSLFRRYEIDLSEADVDRLLSTSLDTLVQQEFPVPANSF
jgi:hypothetical protein